MFRPELYQQVNEVPKRDAFDCLEKYGPKLKWSKSECVIDLGCGDGSVTSTILKPFLPSFNKLVGCDIGELMVEHANRKHGNDRTSFIVWDIVTDVPNHLAESFHHVFSFYALHWIQDQERLFRNIYKLLINRGECFLVFLAYTPVFDFYRALALQPKWKTWLRDSEKYVSPFQDLKEPSKRVCGVMAQAGFNGICVHCEQKEYLYEETNFRLTMEAICPFKIPADLHEEFMEDYMQVVRDMKLISPKEGGGSIVTIQYTLLIANGTK
ncbi:juvenile hormone acid O-methyltransferase-like [Pectinophora gossypiella]|uniref:juvenile hormone acid O-methyltransferase-like n=1 Tax=Pectinophora gossypiella TaxID=13191 RepID=UPI00214F31D4|nr:juvenile hormone acid O-methyltransferase-like [Pectinophora gossypiella]